jgi:hypothetical protein
MSWQEIKDALMARRDYTNAPLHDDAGENMAYVDITDGFGVPIISQRQREYHWSPTPIAAATPAWLKAKSNAERFLQSVGINRPIDEIAVMFRDDESKMAWIRDAVSEPGVKMFNSAWDTVHTSPIPSRYDVEYDFLEAPGLGMRVEAMRIDRGISPLHQTLDETWYNPTISPASPDLGMVVVHLSFKTTKDEYELNRAAMVSGGAELVQACHSTYGQFSYYRVKDYDTWEIPSNLYIKPRINTRDPEPPKAPNTTMREDLRGDFGAPGVGRKYSADAMGLRKIKDEPQA